MNNSQKMFPAKTLLLFFGVIIVVALLTSHRGGLCYFSPQSLKFRSQSERTFFAIGLPFYRSSYNYSEYTGNALLTMLVQGGFVSPEPDSTDRWELLYHWNDSWRGGHAALYHVLLRDSEEAINWTKQNPKSAQVLWSEGFRYLRSSDPKEIRIGKQILDEVWRYWDGMDDPDQVREAIQKIKNDNQF